MNAVPALLVLCVSLPLVAAAQTPAPLTARSGLKLLVPAEDTHPTLRVLLPGHPDTDRSIEILFPEHITVREQGHTESRRLYLFEPGRTTPPPQWHRTRNALSYDRSLDGIDLHAEAVLTSDGVRLRYTFHNRSDTSYSMVYAASDPRLTGQFHDVRLERTWVHFRTGFRLLAAETPARLTEPLSTWLPARYHASFTWTVPQPLVRRDPDGITNYDTATAVDQPLIATTSEDHRWVIASFTRTTGNVWSNPELTCQHVDPTPPLPAHGDAVVEVKLLILRGSLSDVLARVIAQRPTLR